MSKDWKRHLPVAAGFAGGLLAVAAAVAKSAEQEAEAEARRRRQSLSSSEIYALLALVLAAIVAAIVLAVRTDGMWPLLPFAVWFCVFLLLRDRARTITQRKPTRKQVLATREAEAGRREAEQQARLESERIEEFGAEGLRLIDQANGAVKRILATEAARERWLGNPDDLDFATDQAMIAESLRQARALRGAIAELVAIPNRTADDDRLRQDAGQALELLEAGVRRRVRTLLACAHEAEEVDRMLQREREEAQLAEAREDVHRRIGAMVYGVEVGSTERNSETAEVIVARVAAFRELKGNIEIQRPNEEVDRADPGEDDAAAGEPVAQEQPTKGPTKETKENVRKARVLVRRIKQLLP